jgi:hypothetical protein
MPKSVRIGQSPRPEKQPNRRENMDCFVAEPVIGPARGRTRWLLATTAHTFSESRPHGSRRRVAPPHHEGLAICLSYGPHPEEHRERCVSKDGGPRRGSAPALPISISNSARNCFCIVIANASEARSFLSLPLVGSRRAKLALRVAAKRRVGQMMHFPAELSLAEAAPTRQIVRPHSSWPGLSRP